MYEYNTNPDVYKLILAKLAANNPQQANALNEVLDQVPEDSRGQIISQILKVSPNEDIASIIGNNGHKSNQIIQVRQEILVPSLPEYARIDQSIGNGAGIWLDEFVDHAKAISPMTPTLFHLSSGLFIVAVVIARRLVMVMPFGRVYPNLFFLWIAMTTLFRKTTSLNIVRDLFHEVFPFLLTAQDTTPEAFLSDFSGKEPTNLNQMTAKEIQEWNEERNFAAQRGWIRDEFSGLMAGMGRDYNAGLMEALLDFYDCQTSFSRSTSTKGRIIVHNSYLSFLGVSTPASMNHHLRTEFLWSNGFWPRFALLTPEEERPIWREPVLIDRPKYIVEVLGRLFSRLPISKWPTPPQAIPATMSEEANKIWKNYHRAVSYDLLAPPLDERLYGTYGRLPIQVLKVAMILAALDWRDEQSPRIELNQMTRAISIVEGWRASAHRVITRSNLTDNEHISQRITQFIQASEPTGITFRDLARNMKDKTPNQIRMVLGQMVEIDEIEKESVGSGPKGGRPTERFHLAES